MEGIVGETMRKQRLELDWVGKDEEPKLEPRILIHEQSLSVGSGESLLIHGDNLLGLKALESDFTGRIKCCYIDPPFNTQQAFDHYDDGLEHSVWLSMMKNRLQIIHKLLAKDGTLFVHIDDNELGYLLVLLDEIFGRGNRLYIVSFKQGSATGHKAINPGCVNTTNFILIYSKDKSHWTPNRVFTERERDERYGQYIENVADDYKKWRLTTLMKGFANAKNLSEKDARALVKGQPELLDEFVIENARSVVQLARPDYKNVGAETRKLIDKSQEDPDKVFRLEREEGLSTIYLLGGKRILFYSDKLKNIDGRLVAGEPLTTLWDDILSNNLHAEGGVDFPKGKKPEALIKRILEMSTNPGDWVLDSFAGSGTTAAAAQKFGRKWIAIELGDHAVTHIQPRLKRVVEGSDESGITKAVSWKGGGGFKFMRLAPSLLLKDSFGNWIISPKYNAMQLAEAVCKHEGFRFWPDQNLFWKQGFSAEKDYIFVTTEFLTADRIERIAASMKPDETLLICAKAFRVPANKYPNITIKKIPQMLLGRCEFGRDDYSLNVKEPVQEEMGLDEADI
jgi:adenine-specific DNA-methyltransferase